MRAIPVEIRRRILDDCDGGMTEKAAAAKWKVGRSTIAKIKHQRRELGHIGVLREFLRNSPKLFSQIECENYFNHAGFSLY